MRQTRTRPQKIDMAADDPDEEYFGEIINREEEIEIMEALNKSFLNKYSTTSTQQLASSLMHQQQPTIHQSPSSNSASNSGSGFSFFKKKLNFNLMA